MKKLPCKNHWAQLNSGLGTNWPEHRALVLGSFRTASYLIPYSLILPPLKKDIRGGFDKDGKLDSRVREEPTYNHILDEQCIWLDKEGGVWSQPYVRCSVKPQNQSHRH